MSNSRKFALKGSDRVQLQGERAIGPTDPHQLVEVSVILRHRQPLPAPAPVGKHMNHSEFAAQYGADPAHIDMIRKFANDYKLQVLERGDEILRRTVTLAGTAAKMEKAFGVELIDIDHPDGAYRGRTSMIQLPEELVPVVQGVFGLDDRPAAQPHFRYRATGGPFGSRASTTAYTPAEVARLYEFPQGINCSSQVIGLIELGGGYRPADVQEYFQSLGMQPPQVKTASVDQAKNRPTTAHSADGEVMLGIEVAGAVAPGATIVAYFAPNTDRGFQDALSMAVHDQLRKPRIISIGWGNPEANWTAQSIECFADVAQEASLLGITVIAACGDEGSSDGRMDGQQHVDFPASCPHVLAAGGTRLLTAKGVIVGETAWNDGTLGGTTGGGYSAVFARPDWQVNASSNSKRGVPDVSGNADPNTGYKILVDGQQMVAGGTSAVAPLCAGLVALLGQKLQSSMGFVNPLFYNVDKSSCFRDISSGGNGAFSAAIGWDPVSGLGSPVGTQLLLQAEREMKSQSQTTGDQRTRTAATH